MNRYGYEIITALVTDLMPPDSLTEAMNDVEAPRVGGGG